MLLQGRSSSIFSLIENPLSQSSSMHESQEHLQIVQALGLIPATGEPFESARPMAVVVTPTVLISALSLSGQSRKTNTGGSKVEVLGNASAIAAPARPYRV
jgi:hypothetical protein